MKVDFSGYATKANIKCKDGRIIDSNAFAHNNGKTVPIAWQHLCNDPTNILGTMYLEHRADGMYGYGVLNENEKAKNVKELLRHGDIRAMSIHANELVEKGGHVIHGDIVEVSLVLKPANPGAIIENVSLHHGDGTYTDIDDEAIIHYAGEVDNFGDEPLHIDIYSEDGQLMHSNDDELEHADSEEGETVEQIFNAMSQKQKNVVYAMVGAAYEDAKKSGKSDDKDLKLSGEGGETMKENAFEMNGVVTNKATTLKHSDILEIAKKTFEEAQEHGSFKNALMHQAATYGIENIDVLFPDAKNVTNAPEFVKRRTEWVQQVLSGTKHSPFSRIRTRFADITADEARARGYLKGNKKVEEVFPVMQRVTTPQTIYKLQKLDRDDILDITEFDVVAWLRAEMRMMLDEEIARAILIGDGRLVTSPDKIKENFIRPIWTDDDFYSYKMQITNSSDLNELADSFIRARLHYEGSGRPVTFMSPETVTELMLQRDNDGKRLYKTETELADALRVSKIIEVPLFYGQTRKYTPNGGTEKTMALQAIIVNLADYTVGADKGGQVTMMDDFDINYNKYEYLIETRMSGALTGFHSAVVIESEVAEGAARSRAR